MSSRKNKNSFKTELTQRIVRLAGKNPAEFAKKVGCSDQLMRKYLKGSMPGADKIPQIANAGNISVNYLLTGQESEGHSSEWTFSAAAKDKYAFLKKILAEANEAAENNRLPITLAGIMIDILRAELKKFTEDLTNLKQGVIDISR